MNVLIIEDEPFAQEELIRLLQLCDPSIHVLERIDSVEESVRWLQHHPHPDLIFMDIQLSDGISFEIFNELEVKSPVIFTTAFDEYAIRAFKVNSLDYLLKPIEESDLQKSLEKYHRLQRMFTGKTGILSQEQVEDLLQLYKPAFKSRLVTKMGSQILHLSVQEMAYLYSEDKVTFVIMMNGKRFMLAYTLDQLERMLDPSSFNRLNRKYLAHIQAIDSIHKHFNSRLKVTLKPPVNDDILISRARVAEFLEWLER